MGKKCNMCGRAYKLAERNLFQINYEYGSNYDMQTWEFALCEDCIQVLVKQFKIPHTVKERTEI